MAHQLLAEISAVLTGCAWLRNLPWPEFALQERLADGHKALGKSTCRATSLNSSGAVCAPTVKTAEAVLPAAAAVAGQGDAITNASAGRGADGACEHKHIKR